MSAAPLDHPHAPERGRTARLLGAFHVSGVFWYRLHLFGVRVMPRWTVAPLVRLFTAFFWVALRRIRRAIAANLEAPLGPAGRLETERRIHRTMLQFAWCLTERYERLAGDVPLSIEIDGQEAWDEVGSSGRGLILVTAHVGNWEVGSALPARQEARHVHLVREEELDPRAQEFVADLLRARMGPHFTTHFAAREPLLAVRLREALERGELVALQADRPRAGGRRVRAELFGRPYDLPPGPLALARASGAPVLPVFVLREGRLAYRLRFGRPIAVGSEAGAIEAAAARIAGEIEAAIRAHPHQWFCFRRLWP